MVESCFSISVFCICSVVFAVLLKQYCREQSMLVALCTCIGVLAAFLMMINPIIGQVEYFFTEAGISSAYISIIFKAAAICFITQITCEICRDSGENAIASVAELWGRGAITLMSVPIIEALIETVNDFL